VFLAFNLGFKARFMRPLSVVTSKPFFIHINVRLNKSYAGRAAA
jgi:hypothetical protein